MSYNLAYCQNTDHLSFALSLGHTSVEFSKEIPNRSQFDSASGFTKYVAYPLFFVYKSFLSSQDLSNCSFYPSCSVYAYQSIQKKGFFLGLLASFDRLSRCHNRDQSHYTWHITEHWFDPVD